MANTSDPVFVGAAGTSNVNAGPVTVVQGGVVQGGATKPSGMTYDPLSGVIAAGTIRKTGTAPNFAGIVSRPGI